MFSVSQQKRKKKEREKKQKKNMGWLPSQPYAQLNPLPSSKGLSQDACVIQLFIRSPNICLP